MKSVTGFGLAAAAAILIILFGSRLLPSDVGNRDATPSPTAGGITPLRGQGTLAPGTYLIDEPFPVRISVTVPDQWEAFRVDEALAMLCVAGEGCDQGARPGIGFWIVDRFGRPCEDPVDAATPTPQPSLAPSVDDLAAALAGRTGYDVVSQEPVTFSGYQGVRMELVTTIGGLSCPGGLATGWMAGAWQRETFAGERSQLLILDVDGVRLLIDGMYYSDTSDADVVEMQEVWDSIRIEGLSGG
jgi:hypothetical protein